jgi:hypothetical protein
MFQDRVEKDGTAVGLAVVDVNSMHIRGIGLLQAFHDDKTERK